MNTNTTSPPKARPDRAPEVVHTCPGCALPARLRCDRCKLAMEPAPSAKRK